VKIVIVRPAAEADLAAAREWYDRQRPELGERFLDAAASAAQVLAEHPDAYPALHREARRAPLRHFPHGLIYRVYPDAIVVAALYHARREPKIWRHRQTSDDAA
jgi:toxin ParE1/3/4